MGCDIHGVVERKVEGHWIAVRTLHGFESQQKNEYGNCWASPLAKARNYERFAALAGVRGDGPAARGLPLDASLTARHLFQHEGDHTPSWLPLAEATAIFLRTEWRGDKLPEHERNYPARLYFSLDDTDIQAYEHRLVFWFDS